MRRCSYGERFLVSGSLIIGSDGQGEDFGPATLDGRDGLKFWKLDGDFVVERHVRAQEVVMRDDEGC